MKTLLLICANELKKVRKNWTEADYIHDANKDLISHIEVNVKEDEKKMLELLKTDPELKRMYNLINSIVGVGMQTAIYLMIHTEGFKAFENLRQLACYCGLILFSKRSGTSLKGRPHVSHITNKKLKTLLHMCALNAVRYDLQLKLYYQRKTEEGNTRRMC